MIGLVQRLKERKLVQWVLAYLAGAWLVLQVLALLADTYDWAPIVMRSVPVLLAGGLLATLVLAWYHGEQGRQRVSGMELLALALVFVVAGAGVGWVQRSSPNADTATPDEDAPDPRSVAVLPFAVTGADSGSAYLGDGIAEEILDALAQVPGLRVSARTSSFQFRDPEVQIPDIARELRVAMVLEGTIRQSGDLLRISVRLVDAAGFRRWSDRFDTDAAELFEVQSTIARTVADALEAGVLTEDAPALVRSAPATAAHDLYLQGLFFWNRRTPQYVLRAIDLFEQAIALEPAYARAHAGVALAWSVVHQQARDIRPEDAYRRAEEAARRAIDLDPRLPDAYAALGYSYYWQWRWSDALDALRRALDLNPNHSTARQWYGELLAQLGRAEEAEAQLRQAVALDPLSPVAHGNLGLVLLINGRTQEAIAQLEATLRMDPAFAFPQVLLHRMYLSTGRFEDARHAGRRWAEYTGALETADVDALVDAAMDSTRLAGGIAVLDRCESERRHPVDIAYYAIVFGDRGRALRALERALEERATFLQSIRTELFFGTLRGDPRYERIVGALDFPPV